ncbi:MAG: DUF4397 domain-containing protein [Longimicrobiaceae bacterium]|jgi:hypothetical protein
MNLFRAFAVLLCAAALAACEENAIPDLTGPMPSARIKFFNFGVGAPGVNFYANDTKLTAIASATGTESTVGVNYGGVAAGDRYTAIQPGQHTFSGRIAAATDKDLPISNVNATIADGRHYSFYQSGIYDATTKRVDAFIVEDDVPATIDWTVARVRFVHAIANANPMTLYATNTETGQEVAIGGEVAYKSAGAFTALPRGTYDLRARYAGSTANVIVRTGVGFEPGRMYTIGARGNITVTTGANEPALDLTINRQG